MPDTGALIVTEEFVTSRPVTAQCSAFCAKAGIDQALEFATVVEVVRAFVGPVLDALSAGMPFSAEWSPGGPWRAKVFQ